MVCFVLGTDIPLSDFSINQQVADSVGKLILDKFSEVRFCSAVYYSIAVSSPKICSIEQCGSDFFTYRY
jgi:hypothetical protein